MPSRETIIREFMQAIAGGRAALFAGAGLPAECGLPTWKVALKQLAEIIGDEVSADFERLMRAQIEAGDYLQAAEIFGVACNQLTKDRRYAALREVFGKDITLSNRLIGLMGIPFRLIVTTNFDNTLEDAYAEAQGRALDLYDNTKEDLRAALAPERSSIVHLHGRLAKPDSLVLTRSDYAEIKTWEWYRNFIRLLLRDYAVLFAGFSFNDPAIRLLLEAMTDELPPSPANQAYALVPGSAKDLFAELRSWNVTVVDYNDDGEHSELWGFLSQLADRIGVGADEESDELQMRSELELVKENLAAGYTHFVASQRHPNAVRSVYAGLVYSSVHDLSDAASDECSRSDVKAKLGDIFKFTETQADHIISEGLDALESDGWVTKSDDGAIRLRRLQDQSLHKDLETLASAVRARALVRMQSDVEAIEIEGLARFVLEILLIHGMAIGHAVVRGRPLSLPKLESTLIECFIDTFGPIKPHWREPLLEATRSMFVNPTESEDSLITGLARMAFITDVLVDAPSLGSLTGLGFVRSVILDANVLLPASLDSHPDEALYARLFEKVDQLGGNLLTTTGFVNEMVSHRAVARREVNRLELEDHDKLVEYVRMYGTYGVSDLIVGFAHSVEMDGFDGGFDEYLRREGIYSDEEATRERLAERGIGVVDPTETTGYEHQRARGWFGALKDEYRGGKDSEVIDHEAVLLELLVANIERSRPVWVVTNDRGLLKALETLVEAHPGLPARLLQVMLTPVQLMGYADLSVGDVDWSGFARLLCNPGYREFEEQIEGYIRERLIREFRDRAAGSITELTAAIHRAVGSLIDEVERTESSRGGREAAFFQRLEDFEDTFYAIVAERLKDEDG